MLKYAFLFSFICSNAFGALAPFYHSVKEIADLLEDPQLVNIIGVGTEIKGIIRTKDNVQVKTQDCFLDIKSTITNLDRPEAPIFKFDFGKLICR